MKNNLYGRIYHEKRLRYNYKKTRRNGEYMRFFEKLFRKKTINSGKDNKMQFSETIQTVERGNAVACKIQIDNDTVKNMKNRYISFDVETTGLSAKTDRIVEIGAVLFENGVIRQKFSTLVNPKIRISDTASAINGITNNILEKAPVEETVYAKLIDFLGDALKQQTVICAHNAKFDMDFLTETLMRLGYNAKIYYVDTLELSRKLVKNLQNYKQNTVAEKFGLKNECAHRALSDAEVCGKILWELLKIGEKECEKQIKKLEKSKPKEQEMEVCAYIQKCIVKNGGDSKWLGFYKNSSNYVDVSWVYSILKFKFGKKGKYIIVEKNALKKIEYNVEQCTMSEGGMDYVRVYFNNPFELEPLVPYIYKRYERCRKWAMEYFRENRYYELEYKNSPQMLNALSDTDVDILLETAEKRRNEANNLNMTENAEPLITEEQISRKDVTIQPVHHRTSLSDICNLNDWEKGYDAGYQFWEKGDELRKRGDIEEAISLFDKARYNGYYSNVLYESYAMAYHKLKDYDNEIDILDEGIERGKTQESNVSRLETRRSKAVQLLYKRQQKLIMKEHKGEKNQKVMENSKKSTGRAILQLSDDMILIERFESVAEAARKTGINTKSIRDAAKGVQKHAGGFVWKYADESGK